MANEIDIWNTALAEIAADVVQSTDEDGVGALYCRMFYPRVLSDLLEWTSWECAITRVTLASVANGRPSEWNYAYAKPSNMAQARYIRAQEDGNDYPLPEYGPLATPEMDNRPMPFLVEGGTIYCNVENAILSYVRNDVTAADLPALAVRAMELELAARIAYPIKKDMKLANDKRQAAEVARVRAVADEENRAPRQAPRYVSDAEYARAGIY